MLRNLVIALFCCTTTFAQERQQFEALLQQASRYGLNAADYKKEPFDTAIIHFFSDLVYGNNKPKLQFEGLRYSPNCYDIPALVANAIEQHDLPALAQQLELRSKEYQTLKKWISYYVDIIEDPQLTPATRDQPNIPLRTRLQALQKALNTIRWLHCLQQQGPMVIVNIPSATMLVYEYGGIAFESKLVVGRRSFPTPVFTSTINEVIIDPWYIVPKEIALKESLPLIKQNTKYIEENNLQVLNNEGQLVNAYTIDWKKVTPSTFNYTLRQSIGCDNSLGRIRFNFENLPGVYLHDTPWTVLFKMNSRNRSFGCVRVEKANELARLILKNNTAAIDSLSKECSLLNRQPQTIPATVKVPVCVLYNTAWFDASGAVRFYEDFYGKMSN